MRLMKTGLVCVSLAAAGIPAAHSSDVEFSSTVSESCSIVVTRHGTLRTNATVRTLTSGGSGGQHGLAEVTATSNIFDLHVDQPTDFLVRPAADTAPEQDYRARIRSTGATTFAWTQASQSLNSGTSNVRIQFRARKFVGSSFANGDYTAIVVIRCE